MRYQIPHQILEDTFQHFRQCGKGRRECQVVWTSSWSRPELISESIHTGHRAHVGGFEVDDDWLSRLWLDLAEKNIGVRIQVHTHPREAFHSYTDDQYPIVHTPGFLSLVIPDFAMGSVSLRNAFLAEIDKGGKWRQVSINSRLEIT